MIMHKSFEAILPPGLLSERGDLMTIALRPMNTSELLDRTFFLYRKHFLVFVGIVAIPHLVLLLARIAYFNTRPSVSLMTRPLFSLFLLIIYGGVILSSQAATIIAVSNIHLGRPAGIRSAFAGISGSMVEVLLAMILMGIGVFFGFILLIVPGIFLAIAWSLTIPTVLIEIKGPVESMKRSFALTKGSRFKILVILILVTLFGYIISIGIQIPIGILIGLQGLKNPALIPAWVNVLSEIASLISSCLVVPISTIAISLIYYDQRVRKEGFDLQLMMSSLKSGQDLQAALPIS
jgi:hypothetical protein